MGRGWIAHEEEIAVVLGDFHYGEADARGEGFVAALFERQKEKMRQTWEPCLIPDLVRSQWKYLLLLRR